jgi:uncharacterized FlaG/YvyC family protein
MSGFTKTCIYCNKEIRLSNDTGRWLPYNLDNTAHECKKSNEQPQVAQQSQQPQPQQKQVQEPKSTLTLEDIDKRLRRIEFTLYGNDK